SCVYVASDADCGSSRDSLARRPGMAGRLGLLGRSGLVRRRGPASSYCAYFTEVQHWNGQAWRLQRIATPASDDPYLNGVSCAAARACEIVGYSNSGPLVESWNGRRWARLAAPKLRGESLEGVSCHVRAGCTVFGIFVSRSEREVPFSAYWDGS